MTVPSPCINICTLDTACGLCLGCARTLQEISDWPNLDDAGKRAVWARIAERRWQGLAACRALESSAANEPQRSIFHRLLDP